MEIAFTAGYRNQISQKATAGSTKIHPAIASCFLNLLYFYLFFPVFSAIILITFLNASLPVEPAGKL